MVVNIQTLFQITVSAALACRYRLICHCFMGFRREQSLNNGR